MRAALFAIVLAFLSSVALATPGAAEDAAILHLISFVKESQLTFVRNGKDYGSAEAADHLKGKYVYMKEQLSTADEFIDQVASKSSISGKPYYIRAADGRETPVAEWLQAELAKYRASTKDP